MTRDPAAALAALLLHHALDDLAEHGRATPCQVDPAPFVSDDHAERDEAARACGGCPVRIECAAYADAAEEPHHVWGGADRAPDRRRRAVA